MKGKGLKQRFMGTFLSCVLALSTVAFAPMTVRAEGTLADVDCSGGFAANRSSRIEVTDEVQTYVFTSITNSDATAWYQTPLYFVNAENGDELLVGRSDNAAWVGGANTWTEPGLPDGYDYQASFNLPFEDWDSWFAANKAGVECKITMQQVGDTAVVTLYNNGISTTATIPVSGKVYVSLSGEKCKLTNIRPEGTEIPKPDEPGTDEPGTDEPGTDEPGTDDPGTDTPEDVFLECGAFWSAHTEGFEITEEMRTYVFRSKTNSNAVNNWDTPLFVVFHSGNGVVNGDGYKEYVVLRSDNFYLDGGTAIKASEAFPEGFDWAVWQTANRAGVDCAVTTQLYNGYALIGVSNNGVTTTYAVPVDASVKNYVSLSGENCTLSNLQTSAQHIDLSAAKASADASANDPGTDKPGTDDPGTDEPGTDTPGGIFLDCAEFWSAHTPGFEITEEVHSYKFHSQTRTGFIDNWFTPFFVAFHSGDGLVNGEGYREYGVLRSDNYHWDGAGMIAPISKASEVFPEGFEWEAWQAANRSGVDCIVTTQLYNGCALIGVSNNGVTTTYTIPIDPAVKNYLALAGEQCTLSDLQTIDQHIDLSAAKASADAPAGSNNNTNNNNNSSAPAAPTSEVRAVAGGEILVGSAWWTGMAIGSNQPMSGDGTWTWVIQASALVDGYGAFSVEIYDPATNGYITTGSDMNAWTAEGFNPASAVVLGVPAELSSNLVEGHTYVVTVTRSGNTFMIQYVDYTEGTVLCTLAVTPGELASNDVMVHVMAQVGTYATAFCEGALADLPASKAKTAGGEVLTGTAWWTGMTTGSNKTMSGDGTWTWTVRASSLMDGYGAFSVEIYDPATNGYITTGSDKNAWTAEGFDPAKAAISGVPAELASNLVEGHTYAVTVTRSGNTFTVRYSDHTTGKEICTLVITPGETVGKDVLIHVMAQVGTFVTAFNAGTLIASLGDSAPIALYVLVIIGLGAIAYGFKKRFAR